MRGHLAALALVVAPALVFCPAFAVASAARPAPITVERAPREAGEPIMAIVSLKSQRVTFYDADGWIMRAPVSTGVTGRETPAGVFAVIEKDKDHHSTMYDDAWMPNMQRITWNGLALHGGPLPGYAASHGCVRMPYDFAEEMFDKTRIGMRIIISPNDAEPVEFSHPALPVPNADAIAAAPARADALAGEASEAAEKADEAKKAAAAAAREAATLTALVRKLGLLKTHADAQLAIADKALAVAEQAKTRAENLRETAAARAADLATQLDAATAETKAQTDSATAPTDAVNTDDGTKMTAATVVPETTSSTASVRKLQVQKTRADAQLVSADKALNVAIQNETRARNLEQIAATKAADLTNQLNTAKADAQAKAAEAAADTDATKAAQTTNIADAKAANEAKLLLEPVSIYISRATQMLYVRRDTHKPAPDGGGEVFDSTIQVPITIRDPQKRIGTHVFTAVASNEAGLRWTEVTIDDADSAEDALDRITIPQEVLDRIAPTALPRSSIIVSDEPLSEETNYRTEFVAVLNNYPQGGFLTRRPTTDVVASQDEDDDSFDFFSLFQSNSNRRAAHRRNQEDRSQQDW
jgi:hypothetical protein